MNNRVMLTVTMELLSDGIFGSGYSIPGGEDIAVCQDAEGYPYLKGSTLKGLLRDSLENLVAWTGREEKDIEEILGSAGWNGTADGRRLQLTALTLVTRPEVPDDCFGMRVFTSLENGTVKTDTLRTASCINRGLRFSGELICAEEDVPLISDCLAGIKWAGTLRNRGFGRVKVTATQKTSLEKTPHTIGDAACIRYRLLTETPVCITDLSHSRGNSYATKGYIPGTAIRGMVINTLADRDPKWFNEHKQELLSNVHFLDAVPNPTGKAVLPSIKGFYEDKAQTVLESVVRDGDFTPGHKRAKLGTFCTLCEDEIRYWSAETSGATRIQRNIGNDEDSQPFQTRYLSEGQEFEGYILLQDTPDLAEKIASTFGDAIWLGADRYEGFGKCKVKELCAAEKPSWILDYGYRSQEEIGTVLYLLAMSPLTMLDDYGNVCGLSTKRLVQKLGVSSLLLERCATSLDIYGGYNRIWESRVPLVQMYERGSLFRLQCSEAPSLAALQTLEQTGLGIRCAEGFGQILFLPPSRLNALSKKRSLFDMKQETTDASSSSRFRRARYAWVMEHADSLHESGLSKSQLGDIQALCEKAKLNPDGIAVLEAYFNKNLKERGAKHGSKFEGIHTLITKVLERTLSETLGVETDVNSIPEKLSLLCLLFDFSRKKEET